MEEQEPLTGAAPTLTVTERRAEVLHAFAHWKVKVAVEVRRSVWPLPESEPALDQLPLGAEQLVALEELHDRVERPL